MAYSSSSSSYLIRFHRGGVFVSDPFSYDYEILSEIPNIEMDAINFVSFVKLLVSECSSDIKQFFYQVPGLELKLGLRTLKTDNDLAQCVEVAAKNINVVDIYVSHSVFDFCDATSSSRQHVDNVEQNNASDSDLDDDDYNIYEYDSESEESDTASVDHLSHGEEEIYDTRTRQPDPKPKKMFDDNFLSKIYNGLPRDEFVEKDVSADKDVTDKDNIGDKFPIHDPTVKWKLMRPVLGEKYESPDQLKRALAFYALANGYKLYYEVNNPRRLLAKCCRDAKDRKCPFRLWASWMQNERSFQIKKLNDEHSCSRTYEYGTLITSNWIARNFAKKIMMNPCIKVKEITDAILKKYKCKVGISQARRGKMKALEQYETCLEDHYGKLWSYAAEILNSNPGSTCKMSVDSMPHGIKPIGFGVSWDPIDGQTMLGDSMGIPRPAWPEGITPQDYIIEAATQSEIAISQSPPVESQEQEAPMQEQPVQEQPLQEQPVQRRPVQQPVQRKSERIAQILFNKPPTPGPGLDPDDAISIE
ncbi:hypothetical protein Tco_1211658 [Tanacetum coccineum]